MPEIAKATDWKTEEMPNEVEIIDFQKVFSPQEFERVRLGLIPREMEDKWFIYCDQALKHFPPSHLINSLITLSCNKDKNARE